MKHPFPLSFHSRLIWAIHNARLRYALEVVPRAIRRAIIGDINASVRESAESGSDESEATRLSGALIRLGRLDDFLPDFLSSKGLSGARIQSFEDAGRADRLQQIAGTILLAVQMAAFLSLSVAGLAVLGFLAGALLLPDQFGLHLIGEEEIQLRIFASRTDAESLLGPGLFFFLLATGLASISLGIRRFLRLLTAAVATLSVFMHPWRTL